MIEKELIELLLGVLDAVDINLEEVASGKGGGSC